MSFANENLKFTGEVRVVKYDENMNIVQDLSMKNLVVDTGKNFIAQILTGTLSSSITHMGVGSSTTAAAAAQTALVTELARVSIGTRNASNNVMSFVAVFNPGTATGTIAEAGLFNAGSSGTMICRTLLSSAVTKTLNDTVAITWTVTIT